MEPHLGEESDDKKLVLSFKAGQCGTAYREIYERYEGRVQGVCKRMLACPEDAEEATQETFLRVYQGLGRFNGRYQLGAWVSRIATNVCLDMIRAKKRRPSEPRKIEDLEHEVESPQGEGDPEWNALRRANAETVRSTLESLPRLHRAAIVLRDFDGLSYVDIASKLSISEKQTKALLHRARKNFRKSWTGGTIAGLFLPGRLLSKLRRLPRLEEAGGRAPTAVTDVVGSMGNFAATCSAAVQQCGSIAMERFAGTAVALVVTTAAVGAPVLAHSGTKQAEGPHPAAASAPAEDFGADPVVATVHKREALAEPRERTQAEDPEVAPAPAPVPTPEPTPEPEPTESAPPSEEETGESPQPPPADDAGKPKDDTTPPPVDPSTPPNVAVWFDQTARPTAVTPASYESTIDCATTDVQQQLHTTIADDDGLHPVDIDLRALTSPTITMTLTKNEREITYNGGAPSKTWKRTSSNGLEVSFSGSFGVLGSGNPESVNLPRSGRFDVRLVLDCAAPRVVTEDITFHM